MGSFYLSNNSISPAESIGGTWTQVENAVLRGATETGYVGNDTHVQTVEEMPAHTHSALSYNEAIGSQDASSPAFLYRDKSTTNWRADTIKTHSTGGGRLCRSSNVLTTVLSGIARRKLTQEGVI